jgi:hypothetical protein
MIIVFVMKLCVCTHDESDKAILSIVANGGRSKSANSSHSKKDKATQEKHVVLDTENKIKTRAPRGSCGKEPYEKLFCDYSWMKIRQDMMVVPKKNTKLIRGGYMITSTIGSTTLHLDYIRTQQERYVTYVGYHPRHMQ